MKSPEMQFNMRPNCLLAPRVITTFGFPAISQRILLFCGCHNRQGQYGYKDRGSLLTHLNCFCRPSVA